MVITGFLIPTLLLLASSKELRGAGLGCLCMLAFFSLVITSSGGMAKFGGALFFWALYLAGGVVLYGENKKGCLIQILAILATTVLLPDESSEKIAGVSEKPDTAKLMSDQSDHTTPVIPAARSSLWSQSDPITDPPEFKLRQRLLATKLEPKAEWLYVEADYCKKQRTNLGPSRHHSFSPKQQYLDGVVFVYFFYFITADRNRIGVVSTGGKVAEAGASRGGKIRRLLRERVVETGSLFRLSKSEKRMWEKRQDDYYGY